MTPGAVEGAVLFRDRVDASAFLQTLSEKFAGQVGGVCHRVGPASRPLAHHSLHVFAVYPWFGLLRTSSNVPLSVLDQCRIRWGAVVGLAAERALIRSQPLTWDGQALAIGAEREETVRWSTGVDRCGRAQPSATWCRCTGTGSATAHARAGRCAPPQQPATDGSRQPGGCDDDQCR